MKQEYMLQFYLYVGCV